MIINKKAVPEKESEVLGHIISLFENMFRMLRVNDLWLSRSGVTMKQQMDTACDVFASEILGLEHLRNCSSFGVFPICSGQSKGKQQ